MLLKLSLIVRGGFWEIVNRNWQMVNRKNPFSIFNLDLSFADSTWKCNTGQPLCGSQRIRAVNFEISARTFAPVLAVASACYRKQFCTAPETHSSFAPPERKKNLRGPAFYKHLAPNGAKSHQTLALQS